MEEQGNIQPSEEESKETIKHIEKKEPEKPKEKRPFTTIIREFYDKQYKKLMIIPFAILFLAIFFITLQTITTGDFINRDVTLKGGLTITIPLEEQVDVIELQNFLSKQFASNDLSVRKLKRAGSDAGIIIDSDMDGTKKSEIDALIKKIEEKHDKK